LTTNQSSAPAASPSSESNSASDKKRATEPEHAEQLERLQNLIAYRFRDTSTLHLALTHSSVAYENQAEHCPQDDNEQLEFLGDAVVGLVLTEYLFRSYPELAEGPLTRLRAQFVSRQHLGRVGQRLSLGDYLHLGKGEERSGGRRKTAILANAVEALIAAVYLDGGLESAARVTRDLLLDEKLDLLAAEARSGKAVSDHKSELQEYLQAHSMGQPRYVVTSENGPDHRKTFVVAVELQHSAAGNNALASAAGSRKKHAEQEAARLALERLRSSKSGAELPLTGKPE
jgi:ribonuclease III